MLDLVTGPFHPALEREFVARLRAAKRDPLAPLVVVAPSRRLSARLKELALEALPSGVANVHFHNLYSFARELYGGKKGWKLVEDDLFHEKLAARLIVEHLPETPLRRALETHGGARAILGALKDLREGAVDPLAALELLKEEGLDASFANLAKLHLLYQAALQDRKVHSRSDVVRMAAENAGRLAGARIFYYGFYELVQAQIDLFRAVVPWCDVTLFYPLAGGDPDYAFAQNFFESIVAGSASKRADLAERANPPAPRIASVSGARDEAWSCAKWILEMRERGIPLREIGVVARTLEPYVEHVESLFRDHGIPFSSSASVPVERDPACVAAKLLLGLADSDFRRDEVMDLVTSPLFRREAGDDPVLWGLATRLMGIGHGVREWERRLFAIGEGEFVHREGPRGRERKFVLPAPQVARLSKTVRALIAAAKAPAEGTWSQRAKWARALFAQYQSVDLDDVLGALAALDEVLPPPTAAEFRQTFRQRLARASRPVGREGVAGVRVLDAMAARGLPFRALWVLGMNERVFPRYILEDAFLSDGVRARITHRLGSRMPAKLEGYDEEKLLFRLLRDSASEALVFSYQRSDDRGRLQVPSVFLGGVTGTALPRRPGEKLKAVPGGVLTPREAVVTSQLESGKGLEAAEALGLPTDVMAPALAFLERLENEPEADVLDGRTGPLPEHWERMQTYGLSPTALETYATCGFLYFADKVLGLEELAEPESEDGATALETGSLYHEILEQALQSVDLEEATRRAFDGLETRRSIRYPVLWEAERIRMRKVLDRFLEYDLGTRDGWLPFRFEEEVGGDIAGVKFHGYIDRIDVRGNALRVIDYKKSRAKYRTGIESMVFKKYTHFQPPVYLLLAAEKVRTMGRTIDLGASTSGYFFLEDEEKREDWMEGFELRLKQWLAKVEGRLAELRGGDFVLREGDHCRYCEMRTVCRKNHMATRVRAREWARP